eukprot:COSAG01_NODE_1827_length_9125_cov_2.863314_3_plen_106_part_00
MCARRNRHTDICRGPGQSCQSCLFCFVFPELFCPEPVLAKAMISHSSEQKIVSPKMVGVCFARTGRKTPETDGSAWKPSRLNTIDTPAVSHVNYSRQVFVPSLAW